MLDFLYSIDKTVFYFCNQTITNPFFDVAMPFITDLNQNWFGRGLFVVLWLLLMWKGGKKGRVIGLLLIPLIVVSDQLSSSVIKNIIARPRPCHEIDGVPILDHIHLLVNCGSGYSFPSSHAVNNFAAGIFLSYYYRKWTWAFMSFAFVVAGIDTKKKALQDLLLCLVLGFALISSLFLLSVSVIPTNI